MTSPRALTLLARFDEDRPALRRRLDEAATAPAAADCIREHLARLQRAHVDSLTLHQARLFAYFLEILGDAAGVLAAADRVETSPAPRPLPPRLPWSRLTEIRIVRAAQIALGAAAVATLAFTQAGPALWLAVLAAAGAGAAELLHPRLRRGATLPAPLAEPVVRVSGHALLDHLAAALDAVDRALDEVRASERPGTARPVVESETLEFLQLLRGAALRGDGEGAVEIIETLTDPLLAARGLRAEVYAEGTPRTWFDFQPGFDEAPVTLLPALLPLDGDAPLLRGRVIAPSARPAGGARV